MKKLDLILKHGYYMFIPSEKLETKCRKCTMKNLLIIIAVILNTLLVACTNDQASAAQNPAIDYSAVYNEAVKSIIATDSNFADNMTIEQVTKNNAEVFAELQSTLKASGCYNDKIEKAYFNADSVNLGYKPAEFAAMCMIAN